jgi:preprotein translocase subunit SecE
MGFKPLIFWQEVQSELKLVTWPSRQNTVRLTGIVIAVSVLVGLYVGALDFVFTKVMGLVVQK